MKLTLLTEPLSVIQVADLAVLDLTVTPLFLGVTTEEISVVLPTAAVPAAALAREDDWRGFKIVGPLDFSLVGILAQLASLLAEQGISIFALSTFNTDYILVKSAQLPAALQALNTQYEISDEGGNAI